MIDINNYIKLPREERQKHVKLGDPCLERGGTSTHHKGVLAQFLGTTIPSGRILLCHACNNGKCSNPVHLYWGTDYDNTVIDGTMFGTYKNIWERTVEKYGYEEACRLNKKGDKTKGGKSNRGKPKTEEHKKKIAEAIRSKPKSSVKKGGRKPVVSYNETIRIWQELGLQKGADYFKISKEAFKHRVLLAKKRV